MKALAAAIMGVVALSSTLAIADEPIATIAAPSSSSIVSSQWIQPDADGNIFIKVLAPGGQSLVATGRVALFDVDGRALVAERDAEGIYVLPGVLPGVYRMSYRSEDSYSAYAVQVLEHRAERQLPSMTSIIASTLTPERALRTIARYQPARIERAPVVEQEGGLPVPDAAPLLTESYQVGQNAEGGIDGRLLQAGSVAGGLVPAANVNILIIQDDDVVGQTVSAVDGTFEVSNLSPGFYDFVASGAAGFAALGFELVALPEPLAARSETNPFRLVNTAVQQPGFAFELQLAPPTADLLGEEGITGEESELPPLEPPLAPPMAPGFAPGGFAGGGFGGAGAGGGFGGGAGGGAGGGGIGGLAALGGAIAALAIAASDDDDDLAIPVASP